MQLSSSFSSSSLKRVWFVPVCTCYIPSKPSDTFMFDPRPTYTHNSNVILFCPKCQCKWKSSQKWGLEKGAYHLAAVCDPHWYQILLFAAIIFTLCSRCEDILCTQSLYTHEDIFAIVQGRAMKQTPQKKSWKLFHDLEAEGGVTERWDFRSRPPAWSRTICGNKQMQ